MLGTSELLGSISDHYYIDCSESSFLPRLKDACISEPGNREFWSQVRDQGPSMSFISDTEAAKYGGRSSITNRECVEVRCRANLKI
jgi:hypothetical protein